MIVSHQELEGLGENLISPFNPTHLTPQGYDFSIAEVEQMNGQGRLTVENGGRILPLYYPLPVGEVGIYRHEGPVVGWYLKPGMYLVTFNEQVAIPHDMVGLMWPRSSLLRMGVTLETAVWDAGYEGVSKSVMNVFNPMGVIIEQGARVGHMLFMRLDETSEKPYNGVYQGEGIRT